MVHGLELETNIRELEFTFHSIESVQQMSMWLSEMCKKARKKEILKSQAVKCLCTEVMYLVVMYLVVMFLGHTSSNLLGAHGLCSCVHRRTRCARGTAGARSMPRTCSTSSRNVPRFNLNSKPQTPNLKPCSNLLEKCSKVQILKRQFPSIYSI